MVDVSAKEPTLRNARAEAHVLLPPEVISELTGGRVSRKGDVFQVARLAGIQAAKRCGELIPLCHPLPLDHVDVRIDWAEEPAAKAEPGGRCLRIEAACRCTGRTGVEMEALTAAAVAALTVYDMCKSASRAIEIGPVRLLEKSGGAGGHYRRQERQQ